MLFTHLALSGTIKGTAITRRKGTVVAHNNFFQSPIHSASHGSMRHPPPKYRAMDRFATHVR